MALRLPEPAHRQSTVCHKPVQPVRAVNASVRPVRVTAAPKPSAPRKTAGTPKARAVQKPFRLFLVGIAIAGQVVELRAGTATWLTAAALLTKRALLPLNLFGFGRPFAGRKPFYHRLKPSDRARADGRGRPLPAITVGRRLPLILKPASLVVAAVVVQAAAGRSLQTAGQNRQVCRRGHRVKPASPVLPAPGRDTLPAHKPAGQVSTYDVMAASELSLLIGS